MFLPTILIFYFNPFVKNRTFKNVILLLFSIAFYAYGEPLFVIIALITALINWYIAIWIEKANDKTKKFLTATAIALDILLLVIFKYLTFITKNITTLANNNSSIIEIALPIGISFFTFQMMSYVFDVHYGTAGAQKNPLNVLLYIFLFPQLIAGPIVRYKTVETEITDRKELPEEFTRGIIRFVFGLGKKVLLANHIAVVADFAFHNIATASAATAWLGAIAYTFQIYFDFSGYSDMAIGLGWIFGFHFPENFNYPYIAKSVTDFWHRWHISLSTWFRDYVYIPIGGSRVNKGKWIRNLFIVWALTGIWHGANWTFIVWGLIYFVVLLSEKLIGVEKIENRKIVSRIYTLLVVMFAWVVFRADSLRNAGMYIRTMFGTNGFIDENTMNLAFSSLILFCFAIVLSAPVYKSIKSRLNERASDVLDAVSAIIIFILSTICCLSSSYNPFIYFNF